MNNKEKILKNEKLNNIHNYLIDIYKLTYEGYTSISLTKLSIKHNLKCTYGESVKAVVNLNILKTVGNGTKLKYFWGHDEYPTMDMANKVYVEIERLKLNRTLNKNTEKIIEGRNLVPIIKNVSQVVEQLTKNMSPLEKFVEEFKSTPIISNTSAIKKYNLQPAISVVINTNKLLDSSNKLKSHVNAVMLSNLCKDYTKQKSLASYHKNKKSKIQNNPIDLQEKTPIDLIQEKTPTIAPEILQKLTAKSDKPEYYDRLVEYLDTFKKNVMISKKQSTKAFNLSYELIVNLKPEHFVNGLIRKDVTPELCIELMKKKFNSRKSRAKQPIQAKRPIVISEPKKKEYYHTVKNSLLNKLVDKYELNPTDSGLSVIKGYLYANNLLNLDDKIQLKQIDYIKKNIFGQRVIKTRTQTMSEYILDIAKSHI